MNKKSKKRFTWQGWLAILVIVIVGGYVLIVQPGNPNRKQQTQTQAQIQAQKKAKAKEAKLQANCLVIAEDADKLAANPALLDSYKNSNDKKIVQIVTYANQCLKKHPDKLAKGKNVTFSDCVKYVAHMRRKMCHIQATLRSLNAGLKKQSKAFKAKATKKAPATPK